MHAARLCMRVFAYECHVGGLSGEMEVARTSVVGIELGSGTLECYISGT